MNNADNNYCAPLKLISLNDHVDFLRLLQNLGVVVDIISNNGRIPLRTAANKAPLEVTRQSLSNGGIVHIARKLDWTALLAAADSDHVEVFPQFLKSSTCVVFAIK
jgi:ankyrin repeat protein